MNILFLSAIFPYPLYSGGQVRIYNLLKKLSKNHTITLCSFIRDEKENICKSELNFCHRVETVYRGHAFQLKYLFHALFSAHPFLLSTYTNSEMMQKIQSILMEESIDLIHIEPGYVFPSLPYLSVPLVVSEHNIEHSIYESVSQKYSFFLRLFTDYDVHKLQRAEKKIWNTATAVTAVSEDDATIIRSFTDRPVSVVSNGIDDEYFVYRQKKAVTESFHALFVGNFRWVQNKDAVKTLLEQIWPGIVQRFPKATLEIVGKEFPVQLRSFISSSIHVNEHVADIRESFNRADLLLAPIEIGGGTKYKILEAMASGVPVITTQKGIEGLDIHHNKEIIIVQSTSEWGERIQELINDAQHLLTITKNAREFVKSEYTWNKIAIQLESVWKHAYEKKS